MTRLGPRGSIGSMTTEDTAALKAMLTEVNAKGAGPWRITDRGDFWSFSREEENEDGDVGDDCPSKVIVALLNAAPELLEATDEVARLQAENRVLRAELDGFLPSMDGGPSAASEALGTNAALRSLVAAWKPVVRAADEWQGCGRTKEAKLLGALYALTDAQREAAR